MIRHALTTFLLLTIVACTPAGPPTQPNDREWSLLTADYQWLETVRVSQRKPAAMATRKERIELALENLKKLEPTYNAFMDKVHEYHQRTADPRAAGLLAREKIILGDEYMTVLSRYERALDMYREALELQPGSVDAQQRTALVIASGIAPQCLGHAAQLLRGERQQHVGVADVLVECLAERGDAIVDLLGALPLVGRQADTGVLELREQRVAQSEELIRVRVER
jgi:tetratricopeptide (TPR) repeat protein